MRSEDGLGHSQWNNETFSELTRKGEIRDGVGLQKG
jgi:hypothetical protein